jgi:tetratricopeptide (TPR) repeat protein
VPLAIGRIGDCHLQLAAQDARRYELAAEMYRKVMEHPLADISARSQAEVGLGIVQRKQAESKIPAERKDTLDQSLNSFLNVLHGANLRDGETPDSSWLREAAENAVSILQSQGRLEEAIKIYRRLSDLVPAHKHSIEKKIDSLKSRAPR